MLLDTGVFYAIMPSAITLCCLRDANDIALLPFSVCMYAPACAFLAGYFFPFAGAFPDWNSTLQRPYYGVDTMACSLC